MIQIVDPTCLVWAVLRLYLMTFVCLITLSVCLLYSLLRLAKCTDASEASILCSLAGCAFYGIVISSLWKDEAEQNSNCKAEPIELEVHTVSSSILADMEGEMKMILRRIMTFPCPICLEEFQEGDSVSHGVCGHGFHADCIRPWTEMRKTCCPMCRQHLLRKSHDNLFTSLVQDVRNSVSFS
jgi:hypothetical protein